MKVVLDASVAIKLYVPEVDSDLALEWLAADVALPVPDIFLVEVAQALLRHVREGRLAAADLIAAIRDLGQVVAVPRSSGDLIEAALGFANTLDHRLHDCMYVALADAMGCPLLTADDRLVRKMRARPNLPPVLALGEPIP